MTLDLSSHHHSPFRVLIKAKFHKGCQAQPWVEKKGRGLCHVLWVASEIPCPTDVTPKAPQGFQKVHWYQFLPLQVGIKSRGSRGRRCGLCYLGAVSVTFSTSVRDSHSTANMGLLWGWDRTIHTHPMAKVIITVSAPIFPFKPVILNNPMMCCDAQVNGKKQMARIPL